MNQWTALSLVIFVFTLVGSPLMFEAGEQQAGIEPASSQGVPPVPVRSPDPMATLLDNQRMTAAFETKLDELSGQIDLAQREVNARQAAMFALDQKLVERLDRSAREPTQEDIIEQERKLIQGTAISQLQQEIARQQALVSELDRSLQYELSKNINYADLDQRRARLEAEQARLAHLQSQYREFQLQVGIDQQQQLERTLTRNMSESNDVLALEERKREASAALDRARNELAAREAERAKAQAELEELEDQRRELERDIGDEGRK